MKPSGTRSRRASVGGTLVPKYGGSTSPKSRTLTTWLSSKSEGHLSSASSFGSGVFAQRSSRSVRGLTG